MAGQPVAAQSTPALLPAGGDEDLLVLHESLMQVLGTWQLMHGSWFMGKLPAGLE